MAELKQVDFLIYGKIIIDNIRLRDGTMVRGVLGGGGPQAAFGARLWSDSVGFLSRSGDDVDREHHDSLNGLAIDLAGWARFAGIPTPGGDLLYDGIEDALGEDGRGTRVFTPQVDWFRLLEQPLALPAHYRMPRAIHLITEFPDEPMVQEALRLRQAGALVSLEPLLDDRRWSNQEAMMALVRQVDIVSPDWPAASGVAGSDDPVRVMRYWSGLGPQLVTVRRSHHGSYAWDARHDAIWHVPAVPVDVVDPTGAGNSYSGGACVGWTLHEDARVAATCGAVSAWFLVGRTGLPQMTPALGRQATALLAEHLDRAIRL
jgi:sugar/nucleoside kinase (ribokinase family)